MTAGQLIHCDPQQRAEHRVDQALLIGKVSVNSCGVYAHLLAECAHRERCNPVFVDKRHSGNNVLFAVFMLFGLGHNMTVVNFA